MTGDEVGAGAPTQGELLAALGAAVAGLAGADWTVSSDDALLAAARAVERAGRRLEATACSLAAEAASRHEASGRSTGSAATRLGAALGVPRGTAWSRIEAGRRAGTPAMSALAEGRVTAAQERVVARWVGELPDAVPVAEREALTRQLTALAEEGLGVRSLGVVAERTIAQLDPTWQSRREARQAARRAARLHEPDTDGTSLVSLTCDAPLRALVDAAVARHGEPGQGLGGLGGLGVEVVDPASDTRTAGQRAHDAIAHVLRSGLEATAPSRGVAAIVVRVTAAQLDAIEAGRGGRENGGGGGETGGGGTGRDGGGAEGDGGGGGTEDEDGGVPVDPSGGIVTTDAGSSLSARQALALVGRRSWFLSALRDGREELRRIDVDACGRGPGGRRRRLATALQRLVLYAAGDGGCTHPGCEHAAARCQAHHVVDWSRGGPTTVANLALVCPTHHGWIGTGPDRWRTVLDPARPGTPRWLPPEGGAPDASSAGKAA